MRIYFGHQSIGSNIITGIKECGYLDSTIMPVFKIDDANFNKGLNSFLVHNFIGYNYQPLSKCHAFADDIDKNLHGMIDAAGIKFCFVDFNKNTDIHELIKIYKMTIDSLKAKYPEIIFYHITVPLTNEEGLKSFFKKIIKGDANISRNEFNYKLKETFKNDPIFDLAEIESTGPDDIRIYKKIRNFNNYYLFRGYTDDGGHLNNAGRKIVALKFSQFLESLTKSKDLEIRGGINKD
jgi:hypothetical protein